MAGNREYDWIDDPFDEEKEAKDLLKAKKAHNLGCLVVALVILVLFGLMIFAGCSLLTSLAASGV